MPRITLVLVIGGTLGCGPAAATDDGATAATAADSAASGSTGEATAGSTVGEGGLRR